MPTVRIHRFQSRKRNGESFVSARVAGEEIWFSSKDITLRAAPEAFLSAFLIAAQHQGDRLSCDEPVCSTWLDNIGDLLPITSDWWRLKAQLPLVPTRDVSKPWRWKEKSALFFTCGVDSFHALLNSREKPSALINVHGYDIGLENIPRQEEASRSLKQVAHFRKIPLIEIRTNLRQHSYFSKVKWDHTHGGALAAISHLLGDHFQKFLLGSSTRLSDPRAWGSSWKIDPLWSSGTVKFSSIGAEISRAEKMEAIADQPIVQEHLRVCWRSKEVAANCGICAKCTSTLVALMWSGKFELLKQRFQQVPELADSVRKWHLNPISSPDELDPVHTLPERLPEPVRSAVIARRTKLLGTIHEQQGGKSSFKANQLLPFSVFRPLIELSKDRRVYYHKVPGNVGDDLIHAATYQLFERYGITVTENLTDADQVILCGGGSIGIWENCAKQREEIYQICQQSGIEIILHPQSIASDQELLPDLIAVKFARENRSLLKISGSRLMPDLALCYKTERDYGLPLFPRGVFLRKDQEALFADRSDSIGDPPRIVDRDLHDYFQLAACYRHIITDRLHFAIAGLLLKRRVTLLPNSYHKNRAMWETWLKDLGCEWADSPDEMKIEAGYVSTSSQSTSSQSTSTGPRVGMVMCIHNEDRLLEANLRYHHAVGVDIAYLYLDRCTDRSEEIARSFPWVVILHRDTPDEKHYARTHQALCMDEALAMARRDSLEWLLCVDADEFAFGGYHENDGPISNKDLAVLLPEQRSSPLNRLWLRANLKAILEEIPPEIDQVILETREALPLRLGENSMFWEQEFFIAAGEYPNEIIDPSTGLRRKADRWLGHQLGKSIVRTSVMVQTFNPHHWTKLQGVTPPDFAWNLPINTVHLGWHAHFYCLYPRLWLKKFQDIARTHEHWPGGSEMGFPKLEWARAAARWNEEEARDYLERGVYVSREEAERLRREFKGVIHRPVLGRLLGELMSSGGLEGDRPQASTGD